MLWTCRKVRQSKDRILARPSTPSSRKTLTTFSAYAFGSRVTLGFSGLPLISTSNRRSLFPAFRTNAITSLRVGMRAPSTAFWLMKLS